MSYCCEKFTFFYKKEMAIGCSGHDGWHILVGFMNGDVVCMDHLYYCPFCGKELPSPSEETAT